MKPSCAAGANTLKSAINHIEGTIIHLDPLVFRLCFIFIGETLLGGTNNPCYLGAAPSSLLMREHNLRIA